MNLLFLGDFERNGFFGASHRLPILAKHLEALGVNNHFLTKKRHPNRYFNIFSTLLFPFTSSARLKATIKHHAIDLVIASMPNLTGGLPASLAKKHAPFILDVADYEYYTPFWRIFRPLNNTALHKADLVTTINQFIAFHLNKDLNVPISRIKFLPNGVDFTLFKPSNGGEIKNYYNKRPLIIHTGACYGINFLLNAIPDIVKENPDVLFIFIGVRKRQIYETQIQKTPYHANFTFIDSIPQPELVQYINAAKVCIHIFNPQSKYLSYSQPLKVLEYSACAKPTITRPLEGVYDIFRPRAFPFRSPNLGHCFEASPQRFALKINWLLAQPEARQILGTQAYNIVKKRHDWRVITQTFKELCENLLRY